MQCEKPRQKQFGKNFKNFRIVPLSFYCWRAENLQWNHFSAKDLCLNEQPVEPSLQRLQKSGNFKLMIKPQSASCTVVFATYLMLRTILNFHLVTMSLDPVVSIKAPVFYQTHLMLGRARFEPRVVSLALVLFTVVY